MGMEGGVIGPRISFVEIHLGRTTLSMMSVGFFLRVIATSCVGRLQIPESGNFLYLAAYQGEWMSGRESVLSV